MGGIWTTWPVVRTFIHEAVGFRTGLAVDELAIDEDVRSLDAPLSKHLGDNPPPRFASADIDYSVRLLLRHYGDPSASDPFPVFSVFKDLAADKATRTMVEKVLDASWPLVALSQFSSDTPWSQLAARAARLFGSEGEDFVERLQAAQDLEDRICAWSDRRSVEWKDVLELLELTSSEAVGATYGTFFDQRFIRYLASDIARIDQLNWRKFEALVAERFHREGFNVDLGPGRGDGGVDIRVRPREDLEEATSLVVIQCKRWRSSVPQLVVKALAADVAWEGADHGLLVTTSAIAPAGARTIKVRSYPVRVVDREALAAWLTEMAAHGRGLWMPMGDEESS